MAKNMSISTDDSSESLIEFSSNEISLEDALKNLEINKLDEERETVTKSSVSKLYELLARHKITPDCEFQAPNEHTYTSVFTCRISFSENDNKYTAIGNGDSKKNAKNAAAKALMEKLSNISSPNRKDMLNYLTTAGVIHSLPNIVNPSIQDTSEEIPWYETIDHQSSKNLDLVIDPIKNETTHAANAICLKNKLSNIPIVSKNDDSKSYLNIDELASNNDCLSQQNEDLQQEQIKNQLTESNMQTLPIQNPFHNYHFSVGKTPMSSLQELLVHRNIIPIFELISSGGPDHRPIYRYRASVHDNNIIFTEVGVGGSKKEAKHAAAKALVDKLIGSSSLSLPRNDEIATKLLKAKMPEVSNSTNSIVNYDNDIDTSSSALNVENLQFINIQEATNFKGNSIGLLQEYCVANKLLIPSYKVVMEVGVPHAKQFTITCSVLEYSESGQGFTKKEAKRIAASKMLDRLKNNDVRLKPFLRNYNSF